MMDWLIYHAKPITLTSGGKSHWFVDARKIFEDEHLRKQVLSCWVRSLRPLSAWHFIGVPEGGLCWARAMSDEINAKRHEFDPTATW